MQDFLGSTVDANLPAMQETQDLGLITGFGRFPGGRAWQLTPVFLPAEFPWTEAFGRLQFMGLQRVRHD